ncbi:MAG: alpha/beta hydrolase [Dehalococcoidia bacterium]|nr:alpha/beta hydrolase [Dehalococcoidia bacterium]
MSVEPTTVAVRNGEWNVPVYRKGSGEPLLWLHGAGGMTAGWTPELEALSQHYDVIVPVHPGWDDTEGLEKIDDIHDLVLYYQDFCDALGLESFYLGGHSLGGMFAAELAAARPDLVKKLVLVCPVGLWMEETPVTDMFVLLPKELPEYVFADPEGPLAKQAMQMPEDPDALAQAMYLRTANFAATGKFIWPIPDKGLKKRMHRIKAPTLIAWGEQDRLVPPAYAQAFASRIENAQVAMIPNASHMVALEQTETFAKEVTGFLG